MRIALLCGCTTTIALIAFGCALTHRPTWYRPTAIDYSKLEEDKRAVVTLGDRIGDALNARNSIEIELTDEQLNRWIAEKDEWPTGRDISFEPFRQPYIEFLGDNRVRLAATVTQSGFSMVASFVGRVEVDGEHIVLTVDSLHAGAAPLPWSRIEAALRQSLAEHGGESLAEDGKLRIDNHFVWPNGRRNYRIREITSETGRIRLRLETP